MIVLTRNQREIAHANGSAITPANLSGRSIEEIQITELESGRTSVPLGELFDVSRCYHPADIPPVQGDHSIAQQEVICLRGNCASLSHLGASQSSGTLIIQGIAGEFVGAAMTGGRIVVVGNVGNHAAHSMSGGLLYIDGNAGDHFAGPAPGKQSGMRGGDAIVTGSCGARVAERMRRGTIFIGGDAGDFGCNRMIAGTVVCLGAMGQRWCRGMKRGSLITLQELSDLSDHQFSAARDFELSFLPLIWKHLRVSTETVVALVNSIPGMDAIAPPFIPSTRWVKRRVGDIDHRGTGEILTLQKMTTLASR